MVYSFSDSGERLLIKLLLNTIQDFYVSIKGSRECLCMLSAKYDLNDMKL